MNIYVGNLSTEVSEEDLRLAFETFGKVESVSLHSGRKGSGLVAMDSNEEGQSAIEGLNGTELKGKKLSVNEAKTRAERRGGKGGHSGRGGGYGANKGGPGGGYSGGMGGYAGGKVGGKGGNRGR